MVSDSRNKIINLSLAFVVACFLINCGGGGGGGGGGSSSSSSSSSVVTSCTTSTSSNCTTEMNQQYGLITTKAYGAYDRGYTGDGIKVAVLDGEFDLSHTDLDANFITGYDEEDDNNYGDGENVGAADEHVGDDVDQDDDNDPANECHADDDNDDEHALYKD